MKSILLLASSNNLVTEYLKCPSEKSYLSRDSTYQNVFMMLPFDSVRRVVCTLIASDADPKIEITNEPFSHSFTECSEIGMIITVNQGSSKVKYVCLYLIIEVAIRQILSVLNISIGRKRLGLGHDNDLFYPFRITSGRIRGL